MNLKDIGVKYTNDSESLSLWLHPGTSFGALSMTISTIDKIAPEFKGVWVSAFVIANAYVLGYECDNEDSSIAKFLSVRTPFSVSENFIAFSNLLTSADIDILFEAFNQTRIAEDSSDGDVSTKKKISEKD